MEYLIKIEEWDSELPTGDWVGPPALPLYPPSLAESIKNKDELRKIFRDSHMLLHVSSDQHLVLKNWIATNVPQSMQFLTHGFDFYHPQLKPLFFAHNTIHYDLKIEVNNINGRSETLKPSWNEDLDKIRSNFLNVVTGSGADCEFISDEEAEFRGYLIRPAGGRPKSFNTIDLDLHNRENKLKLWKYLSLGKFIRLLQTQEIWFSRPQYFDDPHEFTTDISGQRSIIQWRINSFARSYNDAVRSLRTDYLNESRPLLEGLSISCDGIIQTQTRRLSELSPILLSSIKKVERSRQESYCISCWQLSEHDSVAMWNQYASVSDGVALAFNFDKTRLEFKKSGGVNFLKVEYIDLASPVNAEMDSIPILYKDVRFKAEKEGRFYFINPMQMSQPGFGLKVNLLEIVKEVRLPPSANKWMNELVVDLLKKYSINLLVKDSLLSRPPQRF